MDIKEIMQNLNARDFEKNFRRATKESPYYFDEPKQNEVLGIIEKYKNLKKSYIPIKKYRVFADVHDLCSNKVVRFDSRDLDNIEKILNNVVC